MPREEADAPINYQYIRHFLHDLAQPLATVTGLVDLLLLELDENDKVYEEIQLISQQLEKVLAIIEEIRRLAREAGSVSTDRPPLS
jgi:signal transduction histidine kinase